MRSCYRAIVVLSLVPPLSTVYAQQPVVTSIVEQGGTANILNPTTSNTIALGRVRSITASGSDAFAAVMQTWRAGESVVWARWPLMSGSTGYVLATPVEFQEELDGGEMVSRQKMMIEQVCGISKDGEIHVSAMVLDTLDTAMLNEGEGRLLDTLWIGDTTSAKGLTQREDEELLGEHEGKFWRSVSQPGMTYGGTPYWLGTTAEQAGERATDVAVWMGIGKPTRVLGTNDRITDYGLRVSGAGLSKFSMSPDGTRLFAIANLTGNLSGRSQTVVSVDMNEQPPRKRIHVQTEDLVGGSSGWEPWKEFTHITVSDANTCNQNGAWFVAGEVSQNTTSRFVLTRENSVLLREGQQVRPFGEPSGVQYTLMGRPLALAVNAKGDWTTIWYAQPSTGGGGEVVILNGEVVLAPSYTISNLSTGNFQALDVRPHLAIGDRKLDGTVDVYAVVRKHELITGAKNEHVVKINLYAGPVNCCPADLSGVVAGVPDGAVEISDLLYFLAQFELGGPGADLTGSTPGQPDGGVTIDDLLYFLIRFEAGC